MTKAEIERENAQRQAALDRLAYWKKKDQTESITDTQRTALEKRAQAAPTEILALMCLDGYGRYREQFRNTVWRSELEKRKAAMSEQEFQKAIQNRGLETAIL